MHTSLQWMSPAPLWPLFAATADKRPYRRPAILRFAQDSFMEDLQAVLQDGEGARLRDFVARPETWRAPRAGLDDSFASEPFPNLKLFQPVHLRFYLVATALTCRVPGLPDHIVRSAAGEKVSFVLRRLEPPESGGTPDPADCAECAWVVAPEGNAWQSARAEEIVAGEEQLPLFALQHAAGGGSRRLFAGLIPVSRREAYVAARRKPSEGSAETAAAADPRLIEAQRQIIDPWADLVQWHDSLSAAERSRSETPTAIAQASALILLDIANYLQKHLPAVWGAIAASSGSSLSGANRALFDALDVTESQFSMKLRAAIAAAKAAESALENATTAGGSASLPSSYGNPVRLTDTVLRPLIDRQNGERRLQTLIAAALPPGVPAAIERSPAKDFANPQGNDWYIARCIYERPQCGLPPTVSSPSAPFQLASFFDPDAPARPLQVALPLDTTPAGLRKYDKNVAFSISNELRRQMSRVKGMKALTDGPLGSADNLDIGMVCSFSIPIITICAMILLMIIVQLLNIVFFWLPFFKICFPLPNLKAKG